MAVNTGTGYATGRRKTASARVWLKPGNGQIMVNRLEMSKYFKRASSEAIARQPLVLTQTLEKYDVWASVSGSGLNSQAGAVRHGIARALQKINPDLRIVLKRKGLLTRDAREKERKKYGQAGARRKFQFSKR